MYPPCDHGHINVDFHKLGRIYIIFKVHVSIAGTRVFSQENKRNLYADVGTNVVRLQIFKMFAIVNREGVGNDISNLQ